MVFNRPHKILKFEKCVSQSLKHFKIKVTEADTFSLVQPHVKLRLTSSRPAPIYLV
jgi:hypothetical protein